MPEEPLHQPHDKLFKLAFGQHETAAAAFRAYLPERLVRHLDLARAKLVPNTYIDEQYQLRESDLLYRIPRHGSSVFVYLLFEHQAQEDTGIALRLLTYMSRIWIEWHHQHPHAALPIIVPFVLAQQATKWRHPPSFAALFDLTPEQRADYADVIPDFTFQLLALAQLPFERIVGTPMGIMALRLLKAHSISELGNAFVWDESLLLKLNSRDYATAIRYICSLGNLDRETFVIKVNQIKSAKLRTNAMTLAEQFEQHGLAKGLEEGIAKGLEEGIEKGVLIGQIRELRKIRRLPSLPTSSFVGRSLAELQYIYDELVANPP